MQREWILAERILKLKIFFFCPLSFCLWIFSTPDGEIGEVIIYHRALSGAETEKLESYLMNKWIGRKLALSTNDLIMWLDADACTYCGPQYYQWIVATSTVSVWYLLASCLFLTFETKHCYNIVTKYTNIAATKFPE